jgi:hypothetical protein
MSSAGTSTPWMFILYRILGCTRRRIAELETRDMKDKVLPEDVTDLSRGGESE